MQDHCKSHHGQFQQPAKDKYGSVQLKDMTQRAMYWVSVDQILPRPSPFRDRLSINHDVDWKWVDTQKLFMESSMMAFQWRSSHGKLFGRSNLYKFNYVADQICDLCGAEKQNIEHIYLQCPRIQSLFKNFERHLLLTVPLSEPEKLIGLDKISARTKLVNKKLGVLRKCVYDAIHAQVTPRWEQVLKQIDHIYVLEYAVAEKNGRVDKVMLEWEL
jgi:hypothetical protein